MPFTKVAPNTNASPSGRKFSDKQVRLYRALGNRFPGQKKGRKPDYYGGLKGASEERGETAPDREAGER